MKSHRQNCARRLVSVLALWLCAQTQAGFIPSPLYLPIEQWHDAIHKRAEDPSQKKGVSSDTFSINVRDFPSIAPFPLPEGASSPPVFCPAGSCSLPERPDLFPVGPCRRSVDCGLIPIAYPADGQVTPVSEPAQWPLIFWSLFLLRLRQSKPS